jgi:hypothetical protein
LLLPSDNGTRASIARRSNPRFRPARTPASSNCVRTAIIPHPMSTPTAAGMIAPLVGITDPTVAPFPRCASGISARCGKMNGIDAAARACASVLSSKIDAQLSSRSPSRSTPPHSPATARSPTARLPTMPIDAQSGEMGRLACTRPALVVAIGLATRKHVRSSARLRT